MRVLVCGGRGLDNQERVWQALNELDGEGVIDVVIEGGASGADALAFKWATVHSRGTLTFNADWSQGRKAGPLRNQKMLDDGKPDVVLALPGGPGTADMVRRARKANVKVIEVES